ncbi:hypothetical protein NL457_28470, partial [Klebsiella pneumoniae]|nr:hypothetical protein [Klebsiella pneumoniae]
KDAWQYLEEFADRTMVWDTTRESDVTNTLNSGLHQVDCEGAKEAKIAKLCRRISELEKIQT